MLFLVVPTVFALLSFFSLAPLEVSALSIPPRAAETTYSGDGTYYSPGLGACGLTNKDSDLIVAVGHGIFDTYPGATANPNNNPICRKKIKATYDGKSVTATIVDRCAGCAGKYDVDFTTAGFKKLASLNVGRIHGLQWEFV